MKVVCQQWARDEGRNEDLAGVVADVLMGLDAEGSALDPYMFGEDTLALVAAVTGVRIMCFKDQAVDHGDSLGGHVVVHVHGGLVTDGMAMDRVLTLFLGSSSQHFQVLVLRTGPCLVLLRETDTDTVYRLVTPMGRLRVGRGVRGCSALIFPRPCAAAFAAHLALGGVPRPLASTVSGQVGGGAGATSQGDTLQAGAVASAGRGGSSGLMTTQAVMSVGAGGGGHARGPAGLAVALKWSSGCCPLQGSLHGSPSVVQDRRTSSVRPPPQVGWRGLGGLPVV